MQKNMIDEKVLISKKRLQWIYNHICIQCYWDIYSNGELHRIENYLSNEFGLSLKKVDDL